MYSGSGWILVGPQFSDGLTTGAVPNTIIGQDNAENTVIEIQVAANIVAIIAFSEFTPKATITGFTGAPIRPGINLASRDTDGDGINNVKFYGIAEKSENLIVNNLAIPAGNFLRGDAESTTTNPLNIQNNSGIAYGINAELNIGIEGSAGVIQHNIEGSNIDFRVRNAGNSNTVLRVDSSLRVGINNEAPDEALDITGNVLASGIIKTNSTTESTTISNGSIIAKGGIGDAFVQLEQPEEALGYYEKAFKANVNNFTTPLYLMKAARVAINLGQNEKALDYLTRIKSEFSASNEAKDVDVLIGKVEASL